MPFEAPEDQDDQSLRLYLKSKEIERGMPVDPKPDPPTFAHWNDVPSSLKCAGQWMRAGRKVIAEELPAGKVAVAQDGGVDDPANLLVNLTGSLLAVAAGGGKIGSGGR